VCGKDVMEKAWCCILVLSIAALAGALPECRPRLRWWLRNRPEELGLILNRHLADYIDEMREADTLQEYLKAIAKALQDAIPEICDDEGGLG